MNVLLYEYQLLTLARAAGNTGGGGAGPTYWSPVYYTFTYFPIGYY